MKLKVEKIVKTSRRDKTRRDRPYTRPRQDLRVSRNFKTKTRLSKSLVLSWSRAALAAREPLDQKLREVLPPMKIRILIKLNWSVGTEKG